MSERTREMTRYLLAAIASGELLAAGCGGTAVGQGGDPDQNATGGSVGSGGARGSGGLVSGTGGAPLVCGASGPAKVQCFSQYVRQTDAGVVLLPCPASEDDGCCNTSSGPPERRGTDCCYAFCSSACCGRPLLVDGKARIAPSVSRRDWGGLRQEAEPAAPHGSVASAWLDDALLEHASVASFARFAMDLLAVGAPAELVTGAHRAALDEVEHARLCFSLAARFGAPDLGPGRLDPSDAGTTASLSVAVARAVREGCIGETIAAVAARTAHLLARDPEVRRALARIAEDEARHAALSFRFVAWACAADPSLRVAVGAAFAEELGRDAYGGSDDLSDSERAEWHLAGRLTPSELRRLERDVKRVELRELSAALADQGGLAAS